MIPILSTFETNLTAWKNEEDISEEEKRYRGIAAETMRLCLVMKHTTLSLIHYRLTSLPDLSPLAHVESINLSVNYLSFISLAGLSSLKELNLSHNGFSVRPDTSECVALERINLFGNPCARYRVRPRRNLPPELHEEKEGYPAPSRKPKPREQGSS